MMRFTVLAAILANLNSVAGTTGYVWPSSYDEIEDIYSLQEGDFARSMGEHVLPCNEDGAGKQHAADWLRTAFHDMITYNAAAGTGGMDGSIWLELDREENNGKDFNETFTDFRPFYSPKVSAADLLAMSVVVLHSSCGGTTKIPFRYGRVDAQVAGPAGVPRTHDPLQKLVDRFATAGFSHEEMITLTACGHTLGGVHGPEHNAKPEDDDEEEHPDGEEPHEDEEDEPDHEEDEEEHDEELEDFDSSPDTFDNRIAIEYLDGTTKNPLVIGANETTNSDHRIFSSDGNKTIAALASSQETFEGRCSKLFSRMINAVPRNVRLSEPLEAIDIKPYITGLYLNDANKLVFSGRIRIRTTQGASAGRDPNDLTVRLGRASRLGVWGSSIINTTYAGEISGLYGETFAWYEFETIVPNDSISKFNIQTIVPSTGKRTVYNNQLGGYPVNDILLYQKPESCVATQTVAGKRDMTVTVLVRRELAIVPLRLDLVRHERRQGSIVRTMRTEKINFTKTSERRGDYVVFKAPVQLEANAWKTTFDVVQNVPGGLKIPFVRTEECVE
ncbi:WSC domain-containing protein [Paramyrothecium foliicola]|nr:WSC domain-containing protein [Paramyrothecium foliicola]